jgi:hypothetical protein
MNVTEFAIRRWQLTLVLFSLLMRARLFGLYLDPARG